MLRDSVSRHGVLTAVCTINCSSKDLCSEADRISYDLSLATLSHELGVFLPTPARSRREVTRQVAGRLVCSYYVDA